jgi:hypothetical protein
MNPGNTTGIRYWWFCRVASLGSGVWTMEQQSQTLTAEPASSQVVEVPSYPVRAFGYGTPRYWALLEALVDGLRAYEVALVGGKEHASTPLPAA